MTEEAGVRSILVAGILIAGVVVYLVAASRMDAPAAQPSGVTRYEAMAARVRSLEAARRNLMVAARLKGLASTPARKSHAAGGVRGAYARGYRDGFDEGYAAGAFLSASARPNPLFFPIPKVQ